MSARLARCGKSSGSRTSAELSSARLVVRVRHSGGGSKSGGVWVRLAGIIVSRTRRAMAVSRMHADEVDTDVALVHRLVAGQFPQWGDRTVEPVRSAGTDRRLG